MPFLLNARLFSYIAVVALVLSISFWIYRKGIESCENEHLRAELSGVKIHEEIENKVSQLPDADLNLRLERWVR